MPTSVKRMAGQSFKFGWTHTNSAKDGIKKAGLFTLFWEFKLDIAVDIFGKGETVPPKYGQLACTYVLYDFLIIYAEIRTNYTRRFLIEETENGYTTKYPCTECTIYRLKVAQLNISHNSSRNGVNA